jgi:nucleolar protein 4
VVPFSIAIELIEFYDINSLSMKDEDDSDEEEESDDHDEDSDKDSDGEENIKDEDEDDDDDESDSAEDGDADMEEEKARKSRLDDLDQGKTVFLKCVPFTASEDDLRECCGKFGPLQYALICVDRITDHSKGTGFVKFRVKKL